MQLLHQPSVGEAVTYVVAFHITEERLSKAEPWIREQEERERRGLLSGGEMVFLFIVKEAYQRYTLTGRLEDSFKAQLVDEAVERAQELERQGISVTVEDIERAAQHFVESVERAMGRPVPSRRERKALARAWSRREVERFIEGFLALKLLESYTLKEYEDSIGWLLRALRHGDEVNLDAVAFLYSLMPERAGKAFLKGLGLSIADELYVMERAPQLYEEAVGRGLEGEMAKEKVMQLLRELGL